MRWWEVRQVRPKRRTCGAKEGRVCGEVTRYDPPGDVEVEVCGCPGSEAALSGDGIRVDSNIHCERVKKISVKKKNLYISEITCIGNEIGGLAFGYGHTLGVIAHPVRSANASPSRPW